MHQHRVRRLAAVVEQRVDVVRGKPLVFYYWGVHSGYRSEYLEERQTHDEVLEGMGAH